MITYADSLAKHQELNLARIVMYVSRQPRELEKTYCKCGAVARYKLCDDCVNEAILDDDTVLAYINSDQEFIKDYMEYTDDMFLSDYEPSEKELEFVKSESDAYKRQACVTVRWINEDRSHFEDWLCKRKVDA